MTNDQSIRVSHEELAKSFDPATIEARWAPMWESRGYFAAGSDPAKPSFSIQLPPPNRTGILHMGHAFNQTIMDALTRYHRMLGFNTLWLPGTDHAGIATQIVVERQLASQGIDRRAIGREKFVEEVWKWQHVSGAAILQQMRRLGASVDWSREYFTMDEDPVAGRRRNVRALVRAGPDLPRQAPRQLGSETANGGGGSRSRNRRRRRAHLGDSLSRRRGCK